MISCTQVTSKEWLVSIKSGLFTRTAACVLVRLLMLTTDLRLSVSELSPTVLQVIFTGFASSSASVYQKTECAPLSGMIKCQLACVPVTYDFILHGKRLHINLLIN